MASRKISAFASRAGDSNQRAIVSTPILDKCAERLPGRQVGVGARGLAIGAILALAFLAAACVSPGERPLRYAPSPGDAPSAAAERPAAEAETETQAPVFRPVFRTDEPRRPETRKARSGPPPDRDEAPPREPVAVPSTAEERQLSNTERRLESELRRVERAIDRFEANRYSREFNDPTDPDFRDRGNAAERRRLRVDRNLIEGELRSLRRQQRLSDQLRDVR